MQMTVNGSNAVAVTGVFARLEQREFTDERARSGGCALWLGPLPPHPSKMLMLMFGAQDFGSQWTIADPPGYATTVTIANVDIKKSPTAQSGAVQDQFSANVAVARAGALTRLPTTRPSTIPVG